MNISTESPSDILSMESLDIEAQGIAHRSDGKVVFVEGALPFEQVRVQVNRKKENWERATLTELVQESSQRVQARCPYFGLHKEACGGCKMQHLEPTTQVAIKGRVLEDSLWHVGKVRAQTILPAIYGAAWGYRFRARMSVRYVHKKQEVLIGFHERKSRYVADMRSCMVLPAAVSGLLLPLRALIAGMDARETCPQIELAVGDETIALVLRHLEPLSDADGQRLRNFSKTHAHLGLQWWLQPKGPDSMQRLDAGDASPDLFYTLPEFGMRMPFVPSDFTQVNPGMNRVLVGRVLRLLQVQKDERIIDWFCGLGNFTLPLATQAGQVLGVEGSAALVERAKTNLPKNPKATAPTDFVCRDLFGITAQTLLVDGQADKWLIDPPRDGAFALCKALVELQQEQAFAWQAPRRIVYVSCNPASLARDAEVLVHSAGYCLVAAGVVNMFPHTAHVESLAVFDLHPSRAE